jgi:excisionase family DNA binding protein
MTKRSTKLAKAGPPEVMTIGEAAKELGVSEMTLRRWHKAGKFVPHIHPISRYRLYKRSDVLRLRRRIETGRAA